MTATEMLQKLLEASGYQITDDTDEEGYRIVKEKENG